MNIKNQLVLEIIFHYKIYILEKSIGFIILTKIFLWWTHLYYYICLLTVTYDIQEDNG